MIKRAIKEKQITAFENYLIESEKSKATIEKYIRDINHFICFADGRNINKYLLIEYKENLKNEYAVTSANSMIAALNAFFKFLGWYDLGIKQFKVQKAVYYPEEKELTKDEYIRLINAARQKRNERLNLIIQTICATGIRVSELQYITVEAAQKGECTVCCKGKTRLVFIVSVLQKKLLKYAKANGITTGMIFITQKGKPINRSVVWREMKNLCAQANVPPTKVFPHNLRHLFARTFYSIEKDIAKLADILGHSSINTTRIYIITTGKEHRIRMENMHLII